MPPPLARLLPDHTKLLIATFATPLTSSTLPPLFTYPYTISSLLNYPHSLPSSNPSPPLSPHPFSPFTSPLHSPFLSHFLPSQLSTPLPSSLTHFLPSQLSTHLSSHPFPPPTSPLPSPIYSPHHSPWCCKVVYPRVFKLRYDNMCLCGCRVVGYPDVTTVPLHYYRSKCFPYTSSPSLLPSGHQAVRN